jgi:homoserine kinase type II
VTTEVDVSERSAVLAALRLFGIARPEGAGLEWLTGGTIRRVVRIDAGGSAYAMKLYSPADLLYVNLPLICDAQHLARQAGIPVPEIVRAVSGESYVEEAGRFLVLSRFVEGHAYAPDTMPIAAARRMGETLAALQKSFAQMPPGEAPPIWSHSEIADYLRGLIDIAARRRHSDAVDARAYDLLRQKWALLETLAAPPAYEPGWTHGDYEWRNVLFDDAGDVAAVIDFDAFAYFSPARDVIRCIALSFPALGPAVDAFFGSYAAGAGVRPETARGYVELYRYLSAYRVWPVSARYLEPGTYDPRWDEFIQPMPAWDWVKLSDRLAEAAARAG